MRITLAPSFPRQLINLLPPRRSRLDNTLLRLKLQIKLHSFFQPFALRVTALPPRSRAAAQVEERDGGREEDREQEQERRQRDSVVIGEERDGWEMRGEEV